MNNVKTLFYIISAFILLPSIAYSSSHASRTDCSITAFNWRSGIVPTQFQGPEVVTAISWCDILQIISNVIGFLFYLAFPIAVAMIIIGGLFLLVSAGNDSAIKKGKDIISFAIWGIIITLCAGVFLGFIIRTLQIADAGIVPWL